MTTEQISRSSTRTHLFTFLKRLVVSPRTVGAVSPSSRTLSRKIASVVPKHFHGHVLELGPGTGSITNALLERGVSPGKILAVEFCGEMIKVLRKRFPTVVTIHGDAGSLRKLLTEHFGRDFEPLEYIISSLPLKSLPESKVREIAGEIDHVLSPTGKLLQFTYDLSSSSVSHFSKLSHRHSRIVWRNLPPARINLFEKH